jgi:hypothetical protein
MPWTLPDAPIPGVLGFSPWRSADGQSHVVVREESISPGSLDWANEPFGLARYTFPAGRFLDRVAIDIPPLGPICWLPDQSDRILFAGTDSRLYLLDFAAGEATGGATAATSPRPVRWEGDPPGRGLIWIHDPCWPTAPELGGRVLVSLSFEENPSGPLGEPQVWWLQLDPNNATIVAAGRLVVPDESSAAVPAEEERLPCVGTAPDGSPRLAYLTRPENRSTWDLWVAPITTDETSGAPRVLRSRRHKVAEGCVGLSLAFSADGRSIYVSARNPTTPGQLATLHRYPVGDES